MEKGCPQGSSLGPTLWLMVMEDWFMSMDEVKGMGVTAQAYADDQILVVTGASARRVERVWENVWEKCEEWASRNKLRYNKEKTEVMFVEAKGRVRAPVVRMGEMRRECGDRVKYLGMVLDKKGLWIEHVKEVRRKASSIGGKFMALARRRWGKKWAVLKCMYEGAVCMMVMYGAGIWGARAEDVRVRKQLRATERPFLRAIMVAYATAPTAALSVLARYVPLEVRARVKYEGDRMWRKRVVLGERPHPAYRGWNMEETGQVGNEKKIRIWVDEVMRDEERKGYGCVMLKEGVDRKSESGDRECRGELEELAVLEGVRWGTELVRLGGEVWVFTDSRETVRMLGTSLPRRKGINSIQRELVESLGEGVRTMVKWQRRGSAGNKRAEEIVKRKIREGGERLEVNVARKKEMRKWIEREEISRWQIEWDQGTTGRWTYEWIPQVGRGIIRTTYKLTQQLTGHGNLAVSLRRFGRRDGEVECERGEGEESARHLVNECRMGVCVRERERGSGESMEIAHLWNGREVNKWSGILPTGLRR
ncbi:uncharacterized protein LOC108911907 [Anoplophora glabripennis]|uniref:uncharacterized protein LOC108911907 n=1 Tax=Anoplophora glabripennis TaxID=217634 RepID=UPI0008758B53|nr:uncharacterized protein LOC108911907 [Anoplophora glabripennis]